MKRIILFFILLHGFMGIADLFEQETLNSLSVQSNALAQDIPGPDNEPRNYFIRGGIFIVGLVLIWFLFYKLIYPFLLGYYSPRYSKNLFWSMFLLYMLAWLSISNYVLFGIGFYYHWAKWIFVFSGAIWMIWFVVIMFRKDSGYHYRL